MEKVVTFIVSKGVGQEESDRGTLGKDSDWPSRAETLRGRTLDRDSYWRSQGIPVGGFWRSLHPFPYPGKLEIGLQGITDLVLKATSELY